MKDRLPKLVAYDDIHTNHNYIIFRERKDRQTDTVKHS